MQCVGTRSIEIANGSEGLYSHAVGVLHPMLRVGFELGSRIWKRRSDRSRHGSVTWKPILHAVWR